jgi:PAS domain S-box-containing protein
MNRTIYPRRKALINRGHNVLQALNRSQTSLHQIVQTIPVAICILDRKEKTYLDINDRFSELIGMPRNQVLYKTDNALTCGLGENNLEKILQRLDSGVDLKTMEIFLFNFRGKMIKCQVQMESIAYAGRPCMVLALTEIKPNFYESKTSENSEKLAAAGEIGRSLAEMLDLSAIYQRLTSAIYQLLPDVSTVYISLYDQRRKRVSCKYAEHDHTPLDVSEIPEVHVGSARNSLQSDVLLSGQAIMIDDLQAAFGESRYTSHYSTPGKPPRSGIYIPMIVNGSTIGLVQVHSLKPGRFQQTDMAMLGLIANTAAIAIKNAQLSQNLERTSMDLIQTYEATIDGWTRALELRDFTTERHTHRVVSLTIELCKKLGLDSREIIKVRRGAQLHDIGKMGIPDQILLKPGPLDESEWRIMRRHPVYAYELLRPIPHFGEVIEIPYCHHEKWDGSGYPRRLKGQEIPLSARIFSIVDVWDALSSNRPYRAAWPPNQVIDYISYQSNKHFEPDVTRAFLDLVHGGGIKTPPNSYQPPASNTYLRY